MQSITPLLLSDFKSKSNIVIGKAEIDSDGNGVYEALPDITDFSISTNIANKVARLCSYSFTIKVLNTDNQFDITKADSPYYGYLKQGRRIKLYSGVKKSGTEYYYQWLIGRVDKYKIDKSSGKNVCVITGRDFLRAVADFKLYSPNTYWGTTTTINTVSGQVRYNMPAGCKGIYIAYLDSTSPYDGSNYEEIYDGTDFAYDWNTNQFCFASQRIPDFVGTANLKVYYMTTQIVENVVGHILYLAGIFADTTERDAWIANSDYVTPTSETIDRVWFRTGISGLEAIRLLAEVVQYRFYFDFEGNAIFKPKSSLGTKVDSLDKADIVIENIEQNDNETYTHVIVTGEMRDRIVGDDETAPSVPTNLALTTGFGESTQAGLAYIKATWDANAEIDFGHYELRIKKNADSDYTEVSTVATSYMFLGLESGVTYNIQIRACDVYENRSAWSTVEDKVTATDSGTPTKIAGETATAILAGIKIEWTESPEDNISYYFIERQESPDNVDWSGAWTERVRIEADMWLDLLLTYSKYYRYRITAYTVAGVAGVTSDFTTAVQPNQLGANDIVANCITADQIAANTITANEIAANTITANEIAANTITVTELNFTPVQGTDVIAKINASAEGITIEADNISISGTTTFASGYDPTGRIATGGAAADVNANVTTISGGKITTGSITATQITGTNLSAIYADLGTITAGNMTINTAGYIRSSGKTSYASTVAGFWMGYSAGYKFNIGNATNWLKWNGSALEIKGRLSVGSATNEDIYFEDSGISFYDSGGRILRFYKSGYSFINIVLESGYGAIATSGNTFAIGASAGTLFYFRDPGTIQLPALTSAPTAFNGACAFKSGTDVPVRWYASNDSAWHRWTFSTAGW